MNELVRAGKLTPEQVADFPHQNMITQAVGPTSEIEVEVMPIEATAGDRFLLCTDSVWRLLSEDQLAEILRAQSLAEVVDQLAQRCRQTNADEKIAAVVVDVE